MQGDRICVGPSRVILPPSFPLHRRCHQLSSSGFGPRASPARAGTKGRGGRLKVRAPRCLKKPRAPATAQSLWRCALAGRAGIGSVPRSRRARCSFHSVRARSRLCPERWPDSAASPEGSVPSSCCAKPPAATGKLRASALVLASPTSQTVPYPKRQSTPLPRLEVTKVARAGRSARALRLPLNILGTFSNVSSLPT